MPPPIVDAKFAKLLVLVNGLVPSALLVWDAYRHQLGVNEVNFAIRTTGLVMTKLDGTANGGVLIGIRNLFEIPVVKIGVGEGVDDIRYFNPGEFVDALFAE